MFKARPFQFRRQPGAVRLGLIALILIPLAACAGRGSGQSDIYDGKVYGIFEPLKVEETAGAVTVSGETFSYTIDKAIGQIVSAVALGDRFLVPGTSFPNPYVGLMPENDPGASRTGGADRPRFGYEKAVEMRPLLWSGELTDAYRFDADRSGNIKTELVSAGPEFVEVKSSGVYTWADDRRPTPLAWEIDYLFDVDGFTRVTVRLKTDKPVKLRWNCFNHAWLAKDVNGLLSRMTDPGPAPLNVRPEETVSIAGLAPDEPALQSHWCPFIHLGNAVTGIEFSQEDFSDRWSGYRDSSVRLEDGRDIPTGSVETRDGKWLDGHDSRGRVDIFTQLYARDKGLELEEFDIRNTTYPFNPGDVRERTLWVQMTPAKHPRDDLNSIRVVWPGPHQINMVRWRGQSEPWSPPSDEQVKLWAQVGINLIVGGANYMSGDYSRPTDPEKTRHFLDTAHGYGIKVIPYVTFSDYNFEAPGYQENAAKWMVSKGIEYANCTSLMCFGAEGWRDHWEKEVDSLLKNFEFDGLYIDHWFHTRICSNPLHGCDGYLARSVTDGYHDFAKRARKLTARYTDGKGIMLLNANMLLFSGVVPWFDIRGNGENTDPRRIPGESVITTWNGLGQGVQSLAYWRPSQDSCEMMNFCTAFMFPFQFRPMPLEIGDWIKPLKRPEWEFARFLWETWRFFGLNRSRRYSNFDSRAVVDMDQPGSFANAFERDGKVLAVMVYLQTAGGGQVAPTRREHLRIVSPETLGLKPGVDYSILDISHGRYLGRGTYTVSQLAALPVNLAFGEPLIMLIEPAAPAPRVVYFRGVDDLTAEVMGDKMTLRTGAVPGSPLIVHVDPGSYKFRSLTAGITPETTAGQFAVFSGTVPEGGVVELAMTR